MTPMLAAARTDSLWDDDARLVTDLLGGDKDAFLRLVRDEHASMVRYAQQFVSTRASADEVVQEAWLGILAGLARFEGRSSLRYWMFAIVARCAKSRAVRESRSVPLSALGEDSREEAVEPDRFFPPGSPQAGRWTQPPGRWPDACAERAETLKLVRRAIERLTGLGRQVILLRDVEGWDAEEVCALLGITELHQRVLLHRARSRVRAELEQHFAAPGVSGALLRRADLQ